MDYIKNSQKLLEHGVRESREKILQLLDGVWDEVDSYKIIMDMMHLEGDLLTIGKKTWDLSTKRNIYLFGAGKACNAMAMAVDEILGARLSKGIVSVKIAEEKDHYTRTISYVGGHPLPNQEGMEAAKAIIEIIDHADEQDLFISVISGGSSALLTYPCEGITLDDEIMTQDILLRAGAKILEINAVRRHISRTNGGRLAERIQKRGAELVNIIVSDAVGALPMVDRDLPVEYSGTPIAPDETTIQDAKDCILNYDLKEKLPSSVLEYLWREDPEIETPKVLNGKVTNFVLNDVPDSCEAAMKIAAQMGIPAMVFSTFLEGESREAGVFMGSLAREIQMNNRPIQAPCFVFCSGETTTKVPDGCKGHGGPGHEMALGFALEARYTKGAVLASVDTEGTDGTTIYAGGMSDSLTIYELEQAGINIYDTLRSHDAGGALQTIGNCIYTGNTGTNLCDFNVMYIPKVD